MLDRNLLKVKVRFWIGNCCILGLDVGVEDVG